MHALQRIPVQLEADVERLRAGADPVEFDQFFRSWGHIFFTHSGSSNFLWATGLPSE